MVEDTKAVGDYVDFFDDFAKVWKQGVIIETRLISIQPGKEENICIQSLHESKAFFFQSNSRKIAKFRYFTKNMTLVEDDLDQDSQFSTEMQMYYQQIDLDYIQSDVSNSSNVSDQENIDPNIPI